MAVSGPGVEAGIYHENFSMIDYNKVMRQIFGGSKLDILKRDILRWQYYSIHNKRFRDVAEERGYTDYIDGIDCYMLDGYIYSCTMNGKKEVYRVGDTTHNLIDTEEGKACMQKALAAYGESIFPAFLNIHFVS